MKFTGLLRSQASELQKWDVKADIVPPDLSLVREGKEVIIPYDGRACAGTVCTRNTRKGFYTMRGLREEHKK